MHANRKRTIVERVTRALARRRGDVFLRSDFASFGSASQVGRALKTLIEQGRLVKLGVGVYAKAKVSVLSGKPIPVRPLEVLAPIALRELGVPVSQSRLTKAYNAGLSTQVPAGVVLNTGKRRISRKLGFNRSRVLYERD